MPTKDELESRVSELEGELGAANARIDELQGLLDEARSRTARRGPTAGGVRVVAARAFRCGEGEVEAGQELAVVHLGGPLADLGDSGTAMNFLTSAFRDGKLREGRGADGG